MKKQHQFELDIISWYGCALCSLVYVILKFLGMNDLSVQDMHKIVDAGQRTKLNNGKYVLSSKLSVNSWEKLGDIIFSVLGFPEYSCLHMATVSLELGLYFNTKRLYQYNVFDGVILQYKQKNTKSKEPYHFVCNSYNPDDAVAIEHKPCGMRLMAFTKQ